MLRSRERLWLWQVAILLASLLILFPLIPGLGGIIFSLKWETLVLLVLDSQWPGALLSTLITVLGSTLLALGFAFALLIMADQSRWFGLLQKQLGALLALPHAAFAIGLVFLWSPSGWLARLWVSAWGGDRPPDWLTIHDPFGISLMLGLAFKESWFLLWVLLPLLQQHSVSQQLRLGQTFGYTRLSLWFNVLIPQLLPPLRGAVLMIVAYSLSVVDMALILGPTNPPTLAVLAWQWLNDPDAQQQAKGYWLVLGLLLLLGVLVLVYRVINYYWGIYIYPTGQRRQVRLWWRFLLGAGAFLPFLHIWLVGLLLLTWSVAAGWFFPEIWPHALTLKAWWGLNASLLETSLWIALASVLLAWPLSLLWLEYLPRRFNSFLYIPLVVPQLLLAVAQYKGLLYLYLEGTMWAVVWSHLLWVLPYMILVMQGSYYAFDARLLLTAQTLGYSRFQACWRVKWPILWPAMMASCAVGFAVSIALYLPTVFSGAGRVMTVTTEAVALSAGGNRRSLAVLALLQALLPLLIFLLSHYGVSRQRRL